MPETIHKFKKRYILIPVIILIITVGGFSVFKTFERRSSTETTTTASLDVSSAPAVAESGSDKSLSEKSKRVAPATGSNVSHFQLSIDVLKERQNFKAQQQRWYAQMAFSGLVSLAAIYVILSKRYPDEVNKWGYSTLAFVMGYWLKSL